MSAKLQAAYSAKRVVVRKLVSGEVMLKFHSMHNLPDLCINSEREMDLLSRKNVTVDALRKSNLKDLVQRKILELA